MRFVKLRRVLPLCGVLAAVFPLSAQVPFVPSFSNATGASLRNDYSGFVGMQFTVGATPITVTSLGRTDVAGNGATHTVKLVNAQTKVDVPGGSVQIAMSMSSVGGFQYTALLNSLTLQANTAYLLVSQETSGGDQWYDVTGVATTNAAAVNGPIYTDQTGSYVTVQNSAGFGYVPLSFLYNRVTVTQPANGAAFTSGTSISFSAAALPTAGALVTGVQFQLDSQNYGPALAAPPYTLAVNSALLTNGAHSITAMATDSANNPAVSAPVQFSIIGSAFSPLITAQTPGPLRNNYGDAKGHFVGMDFTVASSAMTVYELGRFVTPGNNQSHVLKLVDAATGLDLPGASVVLTLSGAATGQYQYGYLTNPVTLPANTSYYLLSQETAGGDNWYDYGPVTANGAATVNGPVYQAENGSYSLVTQFPGSSYVPVNLGFVLNAPGVTIASPAQNVTLAGTAPLSLMYSAAANLSVASLQIQVDGATAITLPNPAAFYSTVLLNTTTLNNGPHVITALVVDSSGITGTSTPLQITVNNQATSAGSTTGPAFIKSFSSAAIRNNFQGFLGMQFTVGAQPIQISSLGRICVAGNSGTHVVKLVQVSNGADVPGSAVSIAMAGCIGGEFIYSSLANSLTLTAGSSYYLASQEALGGDQWFDYGPVTATGAAIINGPAYLTGTQWTKVPAPSSSFVPVNFLYNLTTTTNLAITVASNASFGRTQAGLDQFSATVTGATVISGVQYYIDGTPFGAPVNNAGYLFTAPDINYGTHILSGVATDSAGNMVTSPPVLLNVVYESFAIGPSVQLYPLIVYNGKNLRNDYSGWVGFRFTTASSFSTKTTPVAIGRLCEAGNSATHILKFVNASDGTDGSGPAWLNMSGCSPGSTVMATSGINLQPNASYFLVSQEVQGGDQWFDVSAVTTQSAFPSIAVPFTIDGPVYWNGLQYVVVPSPGYSYAGLILYSNVGF